MPVYGRQWVIYLARGAEPTNGVREPNSRCGVPQAESNHRPRILKKGAHVKIRLLIADDAVGVTDALIDSLESREANVRVVGRTAVAGDVLGLYASTKPDVLLLDVRFGHELQNTGLEITRELLSLDPLAKVVLFSQFDYESIIREAYRSGAAAFLPKSTPLANVIEAITQVHSGKVYFLQQIAERLALASLQPAGGDQSPQALLDPRQLEVFRLLALGRTNVEIGEAMNLSSKTISQVNQAIKEKLGVYRAADLTLLAVKHQIVTPQ